MYTMEFGIYILNVVKPPARSCEAQGVLFYQNVEVIFNNPYLNLNIIAIPQAQAFPIFFANPIQQTITL